MWTEIEDLPADWTRLIEPELPALANVWADQRSELEPTPAFKTFMERLVREIAVETGVLERLYSIDAGITVLLIERGIDEALIPFGKSDKPASQVVQLIRDQEMAVNGLFDFVRNGRSLSTSYIKELHQVLTAHQPTTDAVTSDGRILEVELLRGDWRKSASRASDQSDLFYAPPEQVPSEMDRLIGLHATHLTMGVSPDIEAAWLHHRFTQIHPFQDGNGRVARCLASLVLIQARWFPLSIVDEKRDAYIAALRTADNGDLSPLITIFADAQKKAFVKSLSLLRQVADEGKESRAIVAAVANRIVAQRIQTNATRCEIASHLADALVGVTLHKFESVKQEIEVGLRVAAPQTRIFIDSSKPENTTWFGGDIIWAAKEYDYFANRRDFAAWVRLKIVVDNDTELLISFHVPGYQYRGLLACAPLIFRREHGEDGSTTVDHQTLSEAPFYFSYVDTLEEVKARFEKWLEEVVQNGLIYWQELP